jgi:peptidyl-prolyl cis-trans isomerase D
MLNDFRSLASGLAAKILLTLLILSFAVWGIDDMVRHSGSNITIATIGSETIDANEFNQELRRSTEAMRRTMGDHFNPEMIRMTNLHVQVLQKLIGQKLLAMESSALGLLPSDTDVVRQIRSNPMFHDSKGNFDKALFEGMLRNSNLSEKIYVDNVRKNMAVDLLISSLIANVPVPDEEAKTLLATREEQRHVTLYTLSPSLVSNVPQPDAQTIKDYYNTHSRSFTAPEYRNLSYVVLSGDEIRKHISVSEDELLKAFREHKDEFKRSERRTVEQLLYATEDKAKKALSMLRSGTAFDQIANETDILNKNAVSLGEIDRNTIIENASDTVFALKEGEYTDLIQSPFGWHIFRVVKITPASVTPFDDVRASLERELFQRKADEAQSKLANRLEDSLAGGSTLQEAAKELKLEINAVGPVNQRGIRLDGTAARELPALDNFLDTAFKLEDKSQSSLVASKGGKYYIVQVDSIVPERLRALDEVRGLAVANWQMQERTKRLGELARIIANKFDDEASRNAVIAKYNLAPAGNLMMKRSTRTTGSITLPPELVEDAFLQPEGHATKAYPIEKGQYLIAKVNRIAPMTNVDNSARLREALSDIRAGLQQTIQNELLAEYTKFLADKYAVSVNEDAFEAVLK